MNHGSTASARRAVSALFVGNGFVFGVWSAHIAVLKQNYGLSKAQLTIPLFTLALGPIISMPVTGLRVALSLVVVAGAIISILGEKRDGRSCDRTVLMNNHVPTIAIQVRGRAKRNQSGCPMFAPACVGRKRRAKPINCFYSLSENIRRIHNRPTYAGANMGHPDGFRLVAS